MQTTLPCHRVGRCRRMLSRRFGVVAVLELDEGMPSIFFFCLVAVVPGGRLQSLLHSSLSPEKLATEKQAHFPSTSSRTVCLQYTSTVSIMVGTISCSCRSEMVVHRSTRRSPTRRSHKMAFASSGVIRTTGFSAGRAATNGRTRVARTGRGLGTRRARMTAAGATPGATAGLESAWVEFAAKMKETGKSPPVAEWNKLLDVCVSAREPPSMAIWVVSTMRDTGVKPTAASYERVLAVCAEHDDRAAAFHLVEQMFKDGVLLGDVELPEGMEDTLRTILPPEAFD